MQSSIVPRTFMAAFQIETSNCPGAILLEGISSLVIFTAVLGILFFFLLLYVKSFY
jgi:hypothetical protein